MAKKKKPLSTREKNRLARMRRDPSGRLCLEVNRYLNSVGWNALIIGGGQVRGFPAARFGNYEFVVRFTGGKIACDKPKAGK